MGGIVMVGKWYKFIGKSYENFTNGKYYLCISSDIDEEGSFIDNNGDKNGFMRINNKHFDLSNPMDHNPDEVKEEVKEPDLKIETITIVVINDEKYITNTVFDLKQLVKHLKEVTYRLDKQINEG
jgi:hypothetical protein